MRDDAEPLGTEPPEIMPPTHGRILVIMALLGVAGGFAGLVFVGWRFGLGILIGTALAFGSYYWLKHSLRKVFEGAAEGEKPRISAIRYLARYFTLAVVIAVIYATEAVPIIAVLLGMAGFGFAVIADGLIRIFSSFSNRKEL